MLQRLIGTQREFLAADAYAEQYNDMEAMDADLDITIESMRQLISTMAPGHEQVRDNALHQLQILQGRRDSILLASRKPKHIVDYGEMVTTVCAPGLMRSADKLQEVFGYALQVVVKDKNYLAYLLEQLRSQASSMSDTSIIRGRLIVQMAMNLSSQNDMEAISAAGSYSVFRTLDLTPERGYEWVCWWMIM